MDPSDADGFSRFLTQQLAELQHRVLAEYRLHALSSSQDVRGAGHGCGRSAGSASSSQAKAVVREPSSPARGRGPTRWGSSDTRRSTEDLEDEEVEEVDVAGDPEPACRLPGSASDAGAAAVPPPPPSQPEALAGGRRGAAPEGFPVDRRCSVVSCKSMSSTISTAAAARRRAEAAGGGERAHSSARRPPRRTKRTTFHESQALAESPEPHEPDAARFEILAAWCSSWHPGRMSSNHLAGRSKFNLFEENGSDADEKQGASRMLIKPGSSANIAWDIIGLAAVAWDCLTVPLAFFDPPAAFGPMSAVSWAGRVYWTVNILVCFMTGYVDHTGDLVMNRQRIASRYARSWLSLDAFTVVADWFEVLAAETIHSLQGSWILRSLRNIRAVRLLRMVRMSDLTRSFSEHLNHSEELQLIFQFVKFPCLILIVSHFVACLWYGIGTVDAERGWVRNSYAHEKDLNLRYVWSLHWSLAMFAGETMIEADTLLERSFSVATLFCGFIFSSALISGLTTAMTRLIMISSQQAAQLTQLRRYLHTAGISRPLFLRTQRNAQHVMMERKRNVPEESVDLLRVISEPLKVEIHFEIYSGSLIKHPFFADYHEVDPASMRKACHACVTLVSLSVGDVLFAEGEKPTHPRMFFVKSGRTQYVRGYAMEGASSDEQSDPGHADVQQPQWLCEPVLWTAWTHRGTLRATTESRLLALDAEKFQGICSGSSDGHIRRYAQEYVCALNKREKEQLSDLGISAEEMDEAVACGFPELHIEPAEAEDHSQFGWVSVTVNGVRASRRNSWGSMGSTDSQFRRPSGRLLRLFPRPSSVGTHGLSVPKRSVGGEGAATGDPTGPGGSRLLQLVPFFRHSTASGNGGGAPAAGAARQQPVFILGAKQPGFKAQNSAASLEYA